MPSKDIEKRRAAIRKHYYANRQVYLDKAIKQKHDLRDWVFKLKEKSPCMDCRVKYAHYVMDYDHVRGVKKMSISMMINRGSARQIREELKKCELVCSNCHRIRTHNRINTV